MTQRRRRAVPTPRQPEYMRRLRLAQGMPRRNKKKNEHVSTFGGYGSKVFANHPESNDGDEYHK